MEELLNKLIKKGWKPFWWDDKLSSLHKEYGVWKWYIRFHNWMDSELFDLRQLTSKESWLWQFCVENGMVNNDKLTHTRISQVEWWLDIDCVRKTTSSDYEYWLIESALIDEEDLEKFLLENIKIS